jgi:hypothetical protein
MRKWDFMTKEQAIALGESKFWEGMTHRQIAEFQMCEEKLCMPFSVFHEAVEKTLRRPVFTHEFGLNYQGLKNEFFNGKTAPTLEDIINLIPEEKRIIVCA